MDWKPEDVELMTADFHRSTVGRFTLDVGWSPERDPSGQFHCRLILDDNWNCPYEELKTQDPERMMRWVISQMRQAVRRSDGTVESLDVRGVLAGEAPEDSSER